MRDGGWHRVTPWGEGGRSRECTTTGDGGERYLVPGYGDLLLRDNLIVDGFDLGTVSSPSGSGSMAAGWEQVARVPVTFHIVQSDGSFSQADRTVWGYLLVRHGDDEPWQIIDQGTG